MENNSDPNQNPPPSYNDGVNFNSNQAGNPGYYTIPPYFRFWETLDNLGESALNHRAESMVNLNYIPPASTSTPSTSAGYISHPSNDGQISNEVSQLTTELNQINVTSNSETSSPTSSATLSYTLPSSSRSTRSHSETRSRKHRGEAPYNLRSRSAARIPSTDCMTDTPKRSNHNLHLQSGGVMTSNYPNYNTVRNLYNTGHTTGSERMFGQNTNTIHYTPYNTNTNSHQKKRYQIPETPPNLCQSGAMDLTINPYVQSNELNPTSSHQASSSLQHHEAFLNTHQHFLSPENAAMVLMSFQRPSDQNSTPFVQERLPQWLNEHCIRNYSQQPVNQEMYATLQPESHDNGHRTNLNAVSLRQMTPVQRPSSFTMVTPPPYGYPTYPVAPLTPAIAPVFNHINYSYNNYTQNRYDCRRQSPVVQRSTVTKSAASTRSVTTGETGVRRGRTTFLPAQTARLEREFIINPYIAKAQRDCLAEALGVQEKQVKVWFQNRRGREKRNKMADGESTDQGGVGGRTRGRRRGRQPKNMENSYMSSTRYQKPEVTYIEEYTCKPEMRPERPASVIILDEGQDTSPYEEAPNRVMTSNQTFNPRRFLEFSNNGNNQIINNLENPANRLVTSSNATDFSSAQAACESTPNGFMTLTVEGMKQGKCTNVQDKSDSENRFDNRRKSVPRKNIFHQDVTHSQTEQARNYIRNQNSPSNCEILTYVSNLYSEPAYGNSTNENQMHSSNDIEKLENLAHSNQYFESSPFRMGLRKLQESLEVNNEVSTDNGCAVSSNQTTCTPEILSYYTWGSEFSEFPNAICKKEPEYLDDGGKSSEETSSQIVNPFRIIDNEYYNVPCTSSGTNADILSSTTFSTPCNTDSGSTSNVNFSATSTTNFAPLSNDKFVPSPSANFDPSLNINFDASSNTNFVATSNANFCTPSDANLDYEQNYNLATQTNSIYGQNSKTEKRVETYQIDGQDQQPSLMSTESEMQSRNILNTLQSSVTTVTDLLSNTTLDTIYEILEANKEIEKFVNMPNTTKNLDSLNLPGEGLGLLNNLLNNVENNEEVQTVTQGLINPCDIKSEANEQPSSSQNISEVLDELYGNITIKQEPLDDYKEFETPHDSSYKSPLKIILSKNKKNDWSSSFRHSLSRKNSFENNSTNDEISIRGEEQRTSFSGNSGAAVCGSSFFNPFQAISPPTENSIKKIDTGSNVNSTKNSFVNSSTNDEISIRDEEQRTSFSGNSGAAVCGSSFFNPFQAISQATENSIKKIDTGSNVNSTNSDSLLDNGVMITNSSPINSSNPCPSNTRKSIVTNNFAESTKVPPFLKDIQSRNK